MTNEPTSGTDWLTRASAWQPETRAFIDGDYRDFPTATTFESVAPRDGSVITTISDGGAASVDAAVRAARSAFNDGQWRNKPPRERAEIMHRFADLVQANRHEIALAETLEIGTPISQAMTADVDETAEALRWYADCIDKVTFTGSTAVGRQVVIDAASSNMKAVAIEAGGKSPQVVFEDVQDWDRLVDTIAGSIFYNAGQTCTAGSRLIVHTSI